MKSIRVYADTSVFGGAYDDEFKQPSLMFFEQVKNGQFVLVTSAVVQDEMVAAPPAVRRFFIVSWNFQHIVHFHKIPLYNAMNTLKGYQQIAIFSPREVIQYEDEEI
jgi:hypothetical protein